MHVWSSWAVVCEPRRPSQVGPPGFHTTAREPKCAVVRRRAVRTRGGPNRGEGVRWPKSVWPPKINKAVAQVGQGNAGGQSWSKLVPPDPNRPKSASLRLSPKSGRLVAKVGLAVAKGGLAKQGRGQGSGQTRSWPNKVVAKQGRGQTRSWPNKVIAR